MKSTPLLVSLLYLLIIVPPIRARESPPDTLWIRTYGEYDDDRGLSVAATADGGFVVAGETCSFSAGEADVWLVRTDAQGDTLWTRTYGGCCDDRGHSIQAVVDGGFVVGGETGSFSAGYGDFWLIRIDAQGDTLWTRTYGGAERDQGYSVAVAADGGFVVAGRTRSFGTGIGVSSDVWLIRTDAQGDTLWTCTYGGAGHDGGRSVQAMADGGYVITGWTDSYGAGGFDVWLIRTDAQGDTLWTRTYGGSGNDYGYSVQTIANGGFVVTGETRSFGAGVCDVWLIRTDAQGDTLWTRTYGGSGYDEGRSVEAMADGGFVVAGYTQLFGGSAGVWLIRTNAQGDTLWTRTYGGISWDHGYFVQATADGGFVVTGDNYSFGEGEIDLLLIKTDSLGNTAPFAPEGVTVQFEQDTMAFLAWRSVTTSDLAYYVVYQSTDSTFVPAASDSVAKVSAPDTSVAISGLVNGINYYFRVAAVDAAGYWSECSEQVSATPAVIAVAGGTGMPSDYALHTNYPNPFNPVTTIRFGLPEAARARLVVYDLLGREVARLVDGHLEAAYHAVRWNGKDAAGREVPSGIYIARLLATPTAGVTPAFSKSIKMVLLK